MLLPQIDEQMEVCTDQGGDFAAPGPFVAPEMQGDPSAGLSYCDRSMSPDLFARAWQDDELDGDNDADELERIQRILMYESPENSPNASYDVPTQDGAQLGGFMLPPSLATVNSANASTQSMLTEPARPAVPPTTTALLFAPVPPDATAGPPQRASYKAVKRPVAMRTFSSTTEVESVTAEGVKKVERKVERKERKPPIDQDFIRRGSEALELQQSDGEAVKNLRRANRQPRASPQQRDPVFSMVPKPTPRNHGVRWGQLRYNQILHLSKYLRKDEYVFGFLTAFMQEQLLKLALKAVAGVLCTQNNHSLPTASAPVWTFALAQEAWQRWKEDPGWHTEDQLVADKVSWDSLELTYRQTLKGLKTTNPEVHYDKEKEEAKSDRQTLCGVNRHVVSHSLGRTHEKIEEKLKCLDKMLKLGGDASGIHWQIQKQMRPDILRYSALGGRESVLQTAKRSASANWGKPGAKKQEKLTDSEAQSLAQVAANMADCSHEQ